MAKSAQQMISSWQSGMRNPGTVQKYKDGINAVTQSPMAAAATPQATQKYLDAINASVSSGRRQQKLQAVPLEHWKQQAANIGANNLTSGAAKGLTKMTAHFQKFAPVYAQASQAAAAIPHDGSDAAIMQKVMASINVMRQAAGKIS